MKRGKSIHILKVYRKSYVGKEQRQNQYNFYLRQNISLQMIFLPCDLECSRWKTKTNYFFPYSSPIQKISIGCLANGESKFSVCGVGSFLYSAGLSCSSTYSNYARESDSFLSFQELFCLCSRMAPLHALKGP